MYLIERFDGGEWQVWACLENCDPVDQANSFIVGTGPSKSQAWSSAEEELDAAKMMAAKQTAITESRGE